MIIGIDTSRANKPIKTGVEWYSYHVIEGMKRIDSENRYFLYTRLPLQGDLAKLPPNFRQALLRWPPVRLWTLLRLSWEMRFGKFQPQVLFVPAHTIPLWTPEYTVVTVHDIGFERFPQLYKWTDRLYHKFAIRFIKKNAQKIITVSQFCKQEIMEVYAIPAEQIEVVYNGFDHSVYQVLPATEVKSTLKEKYNLDSPYMMFLGRLEAKKNVLRLVEAYRLFREEHPQDLTKLVLVGKPGFQWSEVELLITNNQLDDWIIHVPYAPNEDVVALYNGASLFVFPSLYEGFGIPVLEAMACGTPVVCSNTTALPEVVGDAAIKFNPENVGAILKAMETVLFNYDIAEALVVAGFEQIKKFSWAQCSQETHEIITSLGLSNNDVKTL